MRDPKRAVRTAALDDVSDHLGEVLRRADDLLVEWSRFGTEVRAQVDREAQQVGHAVATAVDGAVARATTTAVERSLADQIGGKLAALSVEIGRLEARAKAASRAVSEERQVDRRVLWGVAAGILIANGLLVAVLLRAPRAAVVAAPEPTRVEAVTPDAAAPATEGSGSVPAEGAPRPAAELGSAATPADSSGKQVAEPIADRTAKPADASGKQVAEPADKTAKLKPVPPPHAGPTVHPVKTGAPVGGTKLLAIPPRRR